MNYLILIEIMIRSIEKDQEFCESFSRINFYSMEIFPPTDKFVKFNRGESNYKRANFSPVFLD